jgi:hypothetical protein
MTDTRSDAIQERSNELVEEYSQKLDEFVNGFIPLTLANEEFAARCSALMITLNRQLARCAAAFGGVYKVDDEEMRSLVFGQFDRNFRISLSALQGEGERVQ